MAEPWEQDAVVSQPQAQPWETDAVVKQPSRISKLAAPVKTAGFMDRVKNAIFTPPEQRDKTQGEAWSKGFTGIPGEISKEFGDAASAVGHDLSPQNLGDLQANATAPGGPIGKLAMDAASAALSPLTGALTSQVGRPVEQATGVRREITGGALSALVPLGAAEDASAASRMAANLSKNAPKALESMAAKTVLKRIAQDTKAGGATAEHALDLVNAANKGGKPMTLADVGGENVKGLLGAVARQPGPAKGFVQKFLDDRDAAAGSRLSGDINHGIAKGSSYVTADALSAGRATQSEPLYKEAFAANQNISSPIIDRILETPAGKRALGSARIKMQNDMTKLGVPDSEIAEQLKEAGDQVPKGGVSSGLKLRTLDYVKRSMDDQIGMARRAGKNDDVRILTGLKNRFVSAIDDADVTARTGPNSVRPAGGLYKQARDAYSGPSRSLDALEEGKLHFNKSPEESAADIANLSPGDREFYKLGAADALKAKILKTGRAGDESRAVVGNQWVRDQLKPLFKDEKSLTKFLDSAVAETKMFDTKTKTIGNSLTAGRVAEDNSPNMAMINHGASALGHASTGNILGTLMSAYKLKREIAGLPNPSLNHAIAKLVLNTDTDSDGMKLLRDFAQNGAPKTSAMLNLRNGTPALLRRAPAINALKQLTYQGQQQ